MRRPLALAALAGALVGASSAIAAPGDLVVVSVPGPFPPADPATAAATSADGRLVAFTAGPAGQRQLYVRDRVAGTTTLASASAAGQPANQPVDDEDVGNVLFALSGDGRYAVFATAATNLVDGDGPGKDVFRKDLQTGQVVLVSVALQGQPANAPVGGDPDVSHDGSRVAFTSGAATNLVAGDASTDSDVVLRDLQAGTTTLVAQSTAGVPADDPTERPAISADGRVVAFEAVATTTTLLPGGADANAANDVYVRDLAAGVTAAATQTTAGATGGGFPDVSGDGRYVVFDTEDRLDAVNDPAAGTRDVYRRDRATGAAALVTARTGQDGRGNDGGARGRISADGTRVAFRSASTDLTAADGNGADLDIYARTLPTRVTERVSARADGGQGGDPADVPALAPSGGVGAFVYTDAGPMDPAPLLAGDADAQPDVFAKELVPTDTAGPSLQVSAPAAGLTTPAAEVTVAGVATDPSGVVGVTVNGTPAALAPAGAFSATVPLPPGATTLTVAARDGSGNLSEVTRTVTRAPVAVSTPPGPQQGVSVIKLPAVSRTRATRLSASLKGRRLTVRFRLSGPARVRVQLVRRQVRQSPRRVVFTGVGRARLLRLAAGPRSVVILTPPRLTPGRYQVRVTVTSAGGVATAAAALRLPPARRS